MKNIIGFGSSDEEQAMPATQSELQISTPMSPKKEYNPVLEEAHKFCRNNMPSLRQGRRCGCFYCLAIFDPEEIVDWLKGEPGDPRGTALCPYCEIDSVLSESAGFPLTKEFLTEMYEYWFT